MSERKLKCTVEGQHVKPCSLLRESCEYGHPKGKKRGLWCWALSTIEGPTRTVFGFKSGDHTERGMIFPHCPFCAVRIDGPIQPNGESRGESPPASIGSEGGA